MSWLKKLTSGLSKTSAKVTASLSSLLGRPAIDAASIEEVEDALIAADLGTRVAARLAEGVRRHKFDGEVTAPALAAALADVAFGLTHVAGVFDAQQDVVGVALVLARVVAVVARHQLDTMLCGHLLEKVVDHRLLLQTVPIQFCIEIVAHQAPPPHQGLLRLVLTHVEHQRRHLSK